MEILTSVVGNLDISTIVTLIFGAFVVFGLLGGFFRGFIRQILHIASAVLWIGGTYFVSDYICKTYIHGITTEGLIALLKESGIGGETMDSVVEIISGQDWLMNLPLESVLVPIVFVLSLLVMWIVSRIVYMILKIVLSIGGRKFNLFGALVGGLIGALEGALIASIIFLPVVGLSTVANETMADIRDKNTDGQYTEIVEFYDEYISPVSNHEIVQFIAENGGQKLLDSLATIDFEGEKVNLFDEATTLLTMGIEATSLKDTNFASLSETDKALLYSLVDDLGESRYLSSLVSGAFSGIGNAIDDGTLPTEIPEAFVSIVKPIVKIFATSTPDNLHDDLITILDVYCLLSDSGTIKAFGEQGAEEQMKAALTERDENGKTLVSKVVEILNKNERTSALVTTLTEMTITMMAGQLGGGEYDVAEVYDNLKTGLNSVLEVKPESYETEEEYQAARDEKINEALTEQGIELDADTVNELGNYIDENIGDKDELSDEDLNNILLHYYEIYSAEGGIELP